MRRLPAAALVFLATFVALAFLALPVAAIFARVTPGKLVAQLGNPVVTDALLVSLKTTLVAQALVLVLGTPAAWVLATRRFRGRSLLVTLVELPLVLPPAVAGIGLLAAFGRTGLAGLALSFARGLGEFGATIMFAGSLRGVTQTLPLAVYAEFDVNFDVALAVSALLVVISAALLVTLKWLPSASTSRFRFATSS